MADGITVDSSELDRLSVELGEVPRKIGPGLHKAIEVNARKVRDSWREKAAGMAHAPAFPFSITYDVRTFRGFGVSIVEAEVGPDKSRAQGALGNLIEFGSVNNGPQGLGLAALQENEADLEQGIAKAIEDLL